MDKLQELLNRKNTIISKTNESENGSMSARDRINLLFDEGSFIETDMFSGRKDGLTQEGVITGYGTVDSRLVFVYAQDGNAEGGAFGVEQAKKISKITNMALKAGAPLVSMLDSKGIRFDEGLDALAALGELSCKAAKASGSILQISAIFGICAGGASFTPLMSDFLVMTKKSALMLNGASVCGEDGKIITSEDMAGGEVNAKENGNAHVLAENDSEAVLKIRELIALLPGNAEELSPETECKDDLNRVSEQLQAPGFHMADVIKQVADNFEFFEISPLYAENILTGFIRINGRTVAVVANNGEIDIKASEKAAGFISFADSFNIPVLTFSDTEGYKASYEEEKNGLSKYVSKLVYAYSNATVPKVTVICSKACTSAGIAMGSRAVGADQVIAWADATIGVFSPDMATVLLYEDKIKDGMTKDEAKRDYCNNAASAFSAAQLGFIDDVINPAETRPLVAAALEMLYDKREDIPLKKHGKFCF